MREMVVAEESAAGEPSGTVTLVLGIRAEAGDGAGEGSKIWRFELAPETVPLTAAFAPFALVKAFVSALLAERPARVVVLALSGVALELARMANALGFDVVVRLPEAARFRAVDEHVLRRLQGLLSNVSRLLPPLAATDEGLLRTVLPDLPACAARLPPLTAASSVKGSEARFGYEAYAFGRRDHNLLYAMQEGFVAHFGGCGRVLDVGCGTGVFLEVLARHGIEAAGVERNAVSARFARSLGHTVFDDDALAFLASQRGAWDGIYCSHFVEHLPVDAAERLIGLVADALQPGGVAVFVFPDPESIRSQLLGFWRDPEHVRFYHPELVATMAEVHGLELEHDSQTVAGRRVVSFSMEPPLREGNGQGGRNDRAAGGGMWSGLLRRLGIAPMVDMNRLLDRNAALEDAVKRLWEVNQTWAWDDNAVLRFRRRATL